MRTSQSISRVSSHQPPVTLKIRITILKRSWICFTTMRREKARNNPASNTGWWEESCRYFADVVQTMETSCFSQRVSNLHMVNSSNHLKRRSWHTDQRNSRRKELRTQMVITLSRNHRFLRISGITHIPSTINFWGKHLTITSKQRPRIATNMMINMSSQVLRKDPMSKL
jgi:hypothetical protein